MRIYVEGVRMQDPGTATVVEGDALGDIAEPAAIIRRRFTFYGPAGHRGGCPLGS
jgi:hypothetical protein